MASVFDQVGGLVGNALDDMQQGLAQEDASAWARSVDLSQYNSDTAVQRRVKDAQAAGFSPLSVLKFGPASDASPVNSYYGTQKATVDGILDFLGLLTSGATSASKESRGWFNGIIKALGNILELVL